MVTGERWSKDMNAMDIIRAVYALDGKLTLEGDKLTVEAPAPLPGNLRQALREHKPSVMVALGAPLDVVAVNILKEIRPNLSPVLRTLSDDNLLALVNWNIIAAWGRAMEKA